MDIAGIQALLRTAGISTGVLDAQLIGRYSTELWRVTSNGRAFVIKTPYRPHRTGEPCSLERDVYLYLRNRIPVSMPDLVGHVGDTLILESIDNLMPFDFNTGPSERHGEAAMAALARLHGAFWQRDIPDFIPDLADRTLRERFAADFDESWRGNRAFFIECCPEFAPIGDALTGRLADNLIPLSTPATLLHGDAHGENLVLTARDEIMFLDWQAARRGNPAFDVAVFTAMSYPTTLRRRVEEHLLSTYICSLEQWGCNLPDPWTSYRYGILRRAARIVEIVKAGFPSARWVFERCARAAVDLDVGDLLAD
jgi:hypothetical protein